jgi:hypothetical protein
MYSVARSIALNLINLERGTAPMPAVFGVSVPRESRISAAAATPLAVKFGQTAKTAKARFARRGSGSDPFKGFIHRATNHEIKIPPHRRRPVPMADIDPGLRQEGDEVCTESSEYI